MNDLGEILRSKLKAVFDELNIEVQVTGIGSLFGVHFTGEHIQNYRNVVNADKDMKKAFFFGMLNEGILLQGGAAGSLNICTTEEHVDNFVDSARKVVIRICK
ncbi:MAG: hypothetical protein CL699_06250 [Chloroflexi bacterium]|nr:hypothetical protein [Chloroflexota bacterium]